ncbi:hypothetical protein EA462_11970 [Natrarchaeobius halalkaliphilus]|uniref:ArsR family transcriptional regulator n=1 Tax=Natrarchaeobius halalkaliphilus TaxID=1679091 RepID=A0A3N6LKD4_9EURY|nr:hypothetical protein [Natrarchaeobius halalkaliphilus]RQG89088.1 hypothetical protein EA462_11970 [Natrarchaeobius halalkaliphilus]
MCYDWGERLFSSPHRLAVLRELYSEPADTQALTDSLPISRVTVQRHLNGCAELGWARKVDGRYELTPVGNHVCEAAATFLDRLSVLESSGDVIDAVATVDDRFDPILLANATVSVAEPDTPHEPIIHYRNAMAETTTDTVRGILPVFSELIVEVHRDLLASGVETDLIAPRPILETAPPSIAETPSTLFSLYVLEQPLEFGLTLTDDAAFFGAYDDGTFAVCIESSEPAFREWATDRYEHYLERARPVPLEADGSGVESTSVREFGTDAVD